MDDPATSTTVVVMGVSGSGKTTVARALAARLGWPSMEGDALHPAANVGKMRAGVPLTDDDRWPWLRAVAGWVGEQEAARRSAVVTCSALKRCYRDLLRQGHPSVRFACVEVARDVLERRLSGRRGHYLPPSLLGSQLATLEALQSDEPGVVVAGGDPLPQVVARVVEQLHLR